MAHTNDQEAPGLAVEAPRETYSGPLLALCPQKAKAEEVAEMDLRDAWNPGEHEDAGDFVLYRTMSRSAFLRHPGPVGINDETPHARVHYALLALESEAQALHVPRINRPRRLSRQRPEYLLRSHRFHCRRGEGDTVDDPQEMIRL